MKRFYPWRTESPHMHTNVLLMCKLMFIMLVAHGYPIDISDPFVPFFSFFDYFRQFSGLFEYTLTGIFVLSGVFLLFNFRVRTMAILLGISMIITLLASKPFFRNHLFIAGCAFLLAGLSDKEKDPWLLYVQLSIVYFGALINKIIQVDWWNGQFMHNWLFEAFNNETYGFIANLISEEWTAKLFSWASMLSELLIGTLLLFRKKHTLAIWIILLFHTALFTITMTRFGHFFDDILIYLLVFLSWPKSDIIVTYQEGRLKILRTLLQCLNWNGQIQWRTEELSDNTWLKVSLHDRKEINEVGLKSLLLYSPGLYFALFVLDSGIRFLFPQPGQHFISVALFWGGLLFFLPIPWTSRTRRKVYT